MSNYLAAPYKTNDGNPPNVQAIPPNQFYLGPSDGSNAVPTFRELVIEDISVETTDDIGQKMTTVGADAVADTMTYAGADDIGTKMTVVGADAIAYAITATGADDIAYDITSVGAYNIAGAMGVTGAYVISNNFPLVTYTNLVYHVTDLDDAVVILQDDLDDAEDDIISITTLVSLVNAVQILMQSNLIALNVYDTISGIASSWTTFGVTGALAIAKALATLAPTATAVYTIVQIVQRLALLGHEENADGLAELQLAVDGIPTVDEDGEEVFDVVANTVVAGPESGANASKTTRRHLVPADIPYKATQLFGLYGDQVVGNFTTLNYTTGGVSVGSPGITQYDGTFTNSNSYTVFADIYFTTYFNNSDGGSYRAHRLISEGVYWGGQQASTTIGLYTAVSSACRIMLESGDTFIIQGYADTTGTHTYTASGIHSYVMVSVG